MNEKLLIGMLNLNTNNDHEKIYYVGALSFIQDEVEEEVEYLAQNQAPSDKNSITVSVSSLKLILLALFNVNTSFVFFMLMNYTV